MNSETKTEMVNPLPETEEKALLKGDAMHMKAWATIQGLKKEREKLLNMWVESIELASGNLAPIPQSQDSDNT